MNERRIFQLFHLSKRIREAENEKSFLLQKGNGFFRTICWKFSFATFESNRRVVDWKLIEPKLWNSGEFNRKVISITKHSLWSRQSTRLIYYTMSRGYRSVILRFENASFIACFFRWWCYCNNVTHCHRIYNVQTFYSNEGTMREQDSRRSLSYSDRKNFEIFLITYNSIFPFSLSFLFFSFLFFLCSKQTTWPREEPNSLLRFWTRRQFLLSTSCYIIRLETRLLPVIKGI